ncbi:MAG: helix-turn-helix domain-containing protein [Pseudomonadota bacterium]
MNKGYGQYCPLALAAEILSQRWTILVISRLIDGCTRFNEIHRGLPRMSPTLLTKRLAELENAGLVKRQKERGRDRYRYLLTPSGEELEEIVMQMAVWGQRWARDMTTDDLDPAFLAWSMHLRLDTSVMPPGQTVMEFRFSGSPEQLDRFWLVKQADTVQMCLRDPGLEVDLLVRADLRRFIETWRGFRNLRKEIRSGRIKLAGPKELKNSFPHWLQLSTLAPYKRQRSGRERRLVR